MDFLALVATVDRVERARVAGTVAQLVTVRRLPFTRTTRLVHFFDAELTRARAAADRRAAATALREGRRTTSTCPERSRLPLIPFSARSCATDTPLRRATLASDSPDRARTRFDASAPLELLP